MSPVPHDGPRGRVDDEESRASLPFRPPVSDEHAGVRAAVDDLESEHLAPGRIAETTGRQTRSPRRGLHAWISPLPDATTTSSVPSPSRSPAARSCQSCLGRSWDQRLAPLRPERTNTRAVSLPEMTATSGTPSSSTFVNSSAAMPPTPWVDQILRLSAPETASIFHEPMKSSTVTRSSLPSSSRSATLAWRQPRAGTSNRGRAAMGSSVTWIVVWRSASTRMVLEVWR